MTAWLSAVSRSILLRIIGVYVPPEPPASAGWLVAVVVFCVLLAMIFRAMEARPLRFARELIMVPVTSIAMIAMAFFAECVYAIFYGGIPFP